MDGGLISILARGLASALGRAAQALERYASGGAPERTEAMRALRRRFPGAPDAWLAYLAEHAPHLASSEMMSAADEPTKSAPEAPVLRLSTDEARGRRAFLKLLPAKIAQRAQQAIEGQGVAVQRRSRGDLVLRPGGSGASAGPLVLRTDREAPRRPPLDLAAASDAGGQDDDMSSAGELRLARQDAPRREPSLGMARQEGPRAPPPELRLAEPPWPEATRASSQTQGEPEFPFPALPPAFGLGGQEQAAHGERDPWPALPPWTPDVADDRPSANDLPRLRQEQDVNAWSA